MLCFEVYKLVAEALQDNAHFVSGYIAVSYIMHPYECNVIGGFFELKQLLAFSFSAKVNVNISTLLFR